MESDYSDDDDYLPVSVGAWGDQSQQQQSPSGHGQVDDAFPPQDPTKTDTNGWAQMIDPHAKKLAGAIGSGGLHRQGKNYKPIDEEYIINQRKGVVIPKAKKDTKGRAPRFSNKQSAPPPSGGKGFSRTSKNPSTATSSFSKPRKTTPAPQPPPPPLSSIRRPPPPSSSGQSGWGAQPLVETPFWEKKNNTPPSQPQPTKATSPPPPPRSNQSRENNNNNKWSTSWDRDSANATQKPPTSGFDSRQPIETTSPASTISPPPGFGPTPQRQYPVKTNKSQLRPPPGFSYTDKPAWGTLTPPQQPDNNAQLHSWGNNNEDKELWKRMDEGTRTTKKEPSTNKSNGGGGGVNKNLDWVSGWDDVSMNPTPPASSSSPSHDGTGGWGAAPLNNNTNWGSSPTDNDKWASASQMTTPSSSSSNGTATPQSPMQFIDQQMAGFNSGRFSDPRKSKYSSAAEEQQEQQQQQQQQQQSKRLPQNYYQRNGTSRPAFMEAPPRVAKPPPSHNPVVISIHLELENGSKIPIAIRKLDNPEVLARGFCQSQNIVNPALIHGIIDLFTQQKLTAMQRYKQ